MIPIACKITNFSLYIVRMAVGSGHDPQKINLKSSSGIIHSHLPVFRGIKRPKHVCWIDINEFLQNFKIIYSSNFLLPAFMPNCLINSVKRSGNSGYSYSIAQLAELLRICGKATFHNIKCPLRVYTFLLKH